MPALVQVAGGPERRVELAGRAVVVGRAAECDLALEEIRASRRHFSVEPTDRGWVLTDLESSNGTAVNGIAVSRVLLSAGDEIEVGGARLRFEDSASGAAAAPPRAPRPIRRSGAGAAWAGAAAAVLGVAIATDHIVVAAAEERAREVDAAVARAVRAEFLLASSAAEPDVAEEALAAFLREHPDAADAPAARAALDALRAGAAARAEAGAEVDALRAARPTLDPEEYRWRLGRILRRRAHDPAAMAEVRRRLLAREETPADAAAEAARAAAYGRRLEEAEAAFRGGDFGRVVALWTAHEREHGGGLAVRKEIARAEDAADERVDRAFREATALRREGKHGPAAAALREALPSVEGTAAARRLRARIDAPDPLAGLTPSAAAAAAGGRGSGARDPAGYERERALLLRAAEVEQLVALRAYEEAAARLRPLVAAAEGLDEVRRDLEGRLADVEGVAALLEALRQAGTGSTAALPASWDAVPPADLLRLVETRVAKTAERRLALAAFAWDHGLREDAVRLTAAVLQDEALRERASAFHARRSGAAAPPGGWMGDGAEVVSRDEWNRRRNREAIAKVRVDQERLLRRLRDTNLVRGIEKIASLRAELDKRRAHALDLIFDEVKYFYPYRDRMREYQPVQAEVDRRVAAVREIWDARTGFTARVDGSAASIVKDLEAAGARLREMGAETTAVDAEFEALRRYFDRELTVRTFFTSPAERAQHDADAAVMAANRAGKGAASEPERRQVEITNEYRMMFGRRALRIDDRLVLAARAHGDDMSRGGFFSHFNEALRDPTKKVPKQACGCSSDALLPGCGHGPDARIREAGYEMAGCSENIHMGSGDPQGAHDGWVHSSGHHRNILTAAWYEMGTGQVGRYWTQNFGIPLSAMPSTGDFGIPAGGRWDDAGGRGTGGDGNDPRDRR